MHYKNKNQQLKLVVTCIGKNDGFGAQFLNCLNGLALARFYKVEYRHKKFDYLEHEVNTNDAEEFINFKNYFTEVLNEDIPLFFSHIPQIADNPNPGKFFTRDVLDELRKIFFSNKPHNASSEKKISIHIRRGDVTKKDFLRWVPLSYYKKIINYCQENYPFHQITVFSEGAIKDFSELGSKNIEFKLNGNALDVFLEMAQSDILITSKSAFSYCAAILSENKIYYIPFWHAPLPHWKKLNLQEDFFSRIKNNLRTIYFRYIVSINEYSKKIFKTTLNVILKTKMLAFEILSIPSKLLGIRKTIHTFRSLLSDNDCRVNFNYKWFPKLLGAYSKALLEYKEIYWENPERNYILLSKNPYSKYMRKLLRGDSDAALSAFAENFQTLPKQEISRQLNYFNEMILSYEKNHNFYLDIKISDQGKFIILGDVEKAVISSYLSNSKKVLTNIYF